MFGIQFYGECWGNRTFTKESLPQEEPTGCVSEDLRTTCPSIGFDRMCAGGVWRNFVFSLEKVCKFLVRHYRYRDSFKRITIFKFTHGCFDAFDNS